MRHLSVFLAVGLLVSSSVAAVEVGGPEIATDDQFYPGMGKFRDIKAVIAAAYADAGNPQDNTTKSIALWKWMLLHLYHCSSRPLEIINNIEPVSEESNACYDTMKFLISYNFAICYASASAMCGIFEAAGFPARARGMSGHTVPECSYDNDWHYLDHDMCGVVFEKDQKTLASVEEIIKDRSLMDWDYRKTHNIPQWPWDGEVGNKTMKGAFDKEPQSCTKYNEAGIAVHPTNLRLRRGESFTRFFNYDRAPWGNKYHWTGLMKNEQYFPTGPSRGQTFVFDPPVDGRKDKAGRPRQPYVSDGNARYANGLFEYAPDLASGVYREGAESVKNLEDGGSPKMKGGKGGGEVVFRQWSPYSICGAPENKDPWQKVNDAVVISGKAVGDGVKVAVSNNNGISWEERAASGAFSEDFSMITRGRYTYLARFTIPEGVGLDELNIRTVTMCAPSMMPHLHDGSNNVTYSADNLAVKYVEPDFSSEEKFKASIAGSGNLGFNGGSESHRCPVQGINAPAFLVMKINTSGKIKRVSAFAMLTSSNPPREGYVTAIQISTDGQTWKDMMRKTLATDADHWRHYIAADVPVDFNATEVYVRIFLEPHTPSSGIGRTGVYAYYDAGPAPELEIEHVWKEGSTARNFKHKVKAGVTEDKYSVSCGGNVTNMSVKFSVANNAALAVAESGQPAAGKGEATSGQAGTAPAEAVPPDPEKKAASLLSVAQNLYLKNNMIDEGKKRLQGIIKDYPETKAAEEAKKILEGLETAK